MHPLDMSAQLDKCVTRLADRLQRTALSARQFALSMTDPDVPPTVYEFYEQLRGITMSRDSIHRTARLAIDYGRVCGDVIRTIVIRLEQVAGTARLPILYLVDSLSQTARAKNYERWMQVITESLPDIVGLVVRKDDADAGSGKDVLTVANKVVAIWRQRATFSEELLQRVEKEMKERSTAPPPSLFGSLDENKTLRQIEEFRRESKRQKWEASHREEWDAFGSREFESLWNTVEPPSSATPPQAVPAPAPPGATAVHSQSHSRKRATPPPPSLPPSAPSPSARPPPAQPPSPYDPLAPSSPSPNTPYSPSVTMTSPQPASSRRPAPPAPSNSSPFSPPPPPFSPPPAPLSAPRHSSPSHLRSSNRRSRSPSSRRSRSPSSYRRSRSPPSHRRSRSPVYRRRSRSPVYRRRSRSPIPQPAHRDPLAYAGPLQLTPFNPALLPYPSNTIFVWDLDETLILFNSLVTGDYCRATGRSVNEAERLGERLERLIFKLIDEFMFFKEIEEFNEVSMQTLAQFDNFIDLNGYDFKSDRLVVDGVVNKQLLAYRYRWISGLYEHPLGAKKIFAPADVRELEEVMIAIDRFADGWLGKALQIIRICASQKTCRNFVVTSGQLVPTLAKMMLFGLHSYIPVENILSSATPGKHWCFESIRARFPEARVVAVGDGLEERQAAQALGFEFFAVAAAQDLTALTIALLRDGKLPRV